MPVSPKKVAFSVQPYLDEAGWPKPVMEDIPKIGLQYLEEMCKLWPYSLRRWEAMQKKDLVELDKIVLEEKPILIRLEHLQYILMWMRDEFKLICKRGGEKFQNYEKARCKADTVHFINYWAWMIEPRNLELGLMTRFPFVLYPEQERVVRELEMCRKNRQKAIVVKSRGVGISWTVCAMDIKSFLFERGFSAIYGSEKEEKVDTLGDPNSLFGKLRVVLYNLPDWMLPKTFVQTERKSPDDNERRLLNPENEARIIGEVGENIGMSGRATVVRIDEAQVLSNPQKINFSLESVTHCRTDIGTIRGMNDFAQRATDGKTYRITIGWENDPRTNPNWKQGERDMDCPFGQYLIATTDPVIIAQEYNRDVSAAVEGAVIPSLWVSSAVDFKEVLEDETEKVSGFDVAAGGKNHSIYILRKGNKVTKVKKITFKTSTEAGLAAFDEAIQDGVTLFNYDLDGIGDSVFGQIKIAETPYPFMVNGIHGNGSVSDRYFPEEGRSAKEKFCNKRAENWWNLREFFKNTYEHRNNIKKHLPYEMISIPNDSNLITQLSQPKEVWRGAKWGVESKKDMVSRRIQSPDYADALVYCFSDIDTSKVIDSLKYTSGNTHFKKFKWFDKDGKEITEPDGSDIHLEQYISVAHGEDMTANALVCYWTNTGKTQLLQVYKEVTILNGLPEEVVRELRINKRVDICEWLGNDAIFKEGKETLAVQYRKNGVFLRQNKKDEYYGSIAIVNRMLDKNLLQISTDCPLVFAQLREWHKSNGKPEKEQGLVKALLQVVTRLRVRGELLQEDKPKYYTTPLNPVEEVDVDKKYAWMAQ